MKIKRMRNFSGSVFGCGTFFAVLMLVFSAGFSLLALATANASAASVSGKWVSATPGEGLIHWDILSKRYCDCEMTLSQSGTAVSASISTTIRKVDVYSQNDPWHNDVGKTSTSQMAGVVQGNKLVFNMSQFGADMSGQIVVTVEGNRMYGNGTYIDAEVTIHYIFNLKSEGTFGTLDTNTVTVIASTGFVVIFIVIIVVVVRPVHIPYTPTVTKVSPYTPQYEPAEERTTGEVPFSYPEPATPVGGIGLSQGTPWGPQPPQGKPLPPKQHYANTYEPPRCPIHPDTALTPHYMNQNDPGSWYCPRCNGYPWGRS
jgi:hypothetical protein